MHSISLMCRFVHDCMKVVSLNNTTDVVEPQESPSIQAHVTEIPPTPTPNQHQDKKSLIGVGGAAVYQNPEVSGYYYNINNNYKTIGTLNNYLPVVSVMT